MPSDSLEQVSHPRTLSLCLPQAAVEMARKYRHVGWYASFVAAYMIILYFQVSALTCKRSAFVQAHAACKRRLVTRVCAAEVCTSRFFTQFFRYKRYVQVPLQASAYKSGEVVQTLKEAFLRENEEGGYDTSMTFRSGEELLDYLGSKAGKCWCFVRVLCTYVRACVRACVCVCMCVCDCARACTCTLRLV